MTSELPSVGVDDIDIRKDRQGEIHVFAHPDSGVMLHHDDRDTGEVRGEEVFCRNKLKENHLCLISFL